MVSAPNVDLAGVPYAFYFVASQLLVYTTVSHTYRERDHGSIKQYQQHPTTCMQADLVLDQGPSTKAGCTYSLAHLSIDQTTA